MPGRARPLDVDPDRLLGLFAAQAGSRQLDLEARGCGSVASASTRIGSSGHECERRRRRGAAADRPGAAALPLGRVLPAARRPACRGRTRCATCCWAWSPRPTSRSPAAGTRCSATSRCRVVPQTSTIASHLPRAVGARVRPRAGRAAGRRRRPGRRTRSWCAASATPRSTTRPRSARSTPRCTAPTRACRCRCCWSARTTASGSACRTPPGWVAARTATGRGLRYFAADGCRPADVPRRRGAGRRLGPQPPAAGVPAPAHGAADGARRLGRRERLPAPAEIVADYARDPLLGTARLLVDQRVRTPDEVLARYDAIARARSPPSPSRCCERPRLTSAPAGDGAAGAAPTRSVVARGTPPGRARRARRRCRAAAADPGAVASTRRWPTLLADRPATRWCSARTSRRKGGVYGVTRGLRKRFGAARVFDTLLDEQTILGLALGAGAAGPPAGARDPVPRLPAQRRGPAPRRGGHAAVLLPRRSTATRWWCGSPATPTRRASAATSTTTTRSAALRDIPGLVVASPARPDDAAAMLRTCVAAAPSDGAVCVFLEPIALYHTPRPARAGRRRLAGAVPDAGRAPRPDRLARGSYGDGARPDARDVRQRAADEPAGRRAARAREGIARAGARPALAARRCRSTTCCARRSATGRVLVVDETRRVGRGRRGRGRRPRRRRLHRPDRPGDQRGQLRPARRRRGQLVLLDQATVETAALALLDA